MLNITDSDTVCVRMVMKVEKLHVAANISSIVGCSCKMSSLMISVKNVDDCVFCKSNLNNAKSPGIHCVSKNDPTLNLKRHSSKLYGSILMVFGRNIQKSLE